MLQFHILNSINCSERGGKPLQPTDLRQPTHCGDLNALRDSSGGPVARTPHSPKAGGLGSIPGQGTRSHMLQPRVHMPQLKIPHPVMKIESPECRH